jgi:riboflavin biosynthesis protein ribF
VHIFDFNEEIYDSEVRVFFIERVRDEVKFSSVEQLKEQLIADKKRVEQILNSHQ